MIGSSWDIIDDVDLRPQDFGLRLFWFQFDPAEAESTPSALGVTARNLRDAQSILVERLFVRGPLPPHRVIEDVAVEDLTDLPSDFKVPMFRGIWYPEMIPMAGGYVAIARTPTGLIVEADPRRRTLSEIACHRQRWTVTVRDQATNGLVSRETVETENDVSERVSELWDAIELGRWPPSDDRN